MAIDFPSPATVGQQYTAAGVTWAYDGAKWLPAGLGAGAVQGINDNRIINGDMRVNQRGATNGTATGYTVDRWGYQCSVAKGSWAFNNNGSPWPGNAFPYSLYFISNSAYTPAVSDYFNFYQAIEADMISDFAWGTAQAQPVTLSFWTYSTLTGTFSGSLINIGSPRRSYPFTFNIPTAGTWTKITITIPGDTAGTWTLSGNGGGLQVCFDFGSGSTYRGPANAWATATYFGATGTVSVVSTNNASIFFTAVKLEIGSVATPFNRQSLAKSMADCQRYYQAGNFSMGGSAGAAGNGWYYMQPFLVAMRAIPTFTSNATAQNNCSGTVAQGIGTSSFQPYTVNTGAGGFAMAGTFTASAEL